MSLDNVHEQHLLYCRVLMKICSEGGASIKMPTTVMIIGKQHSHTPPLNYREAV